METTFEEYKEWTSNEVDKTVKHKYEQALKQLQELLPFEQTLVRTCAHILLVPTSPCLLYAGQS